MEQAKWEKGMQIFGGMGSLYFKKEDLQKILPNYDYGHAFAYLWRRFGPPIFGCDSYKELAQYILTTKKKGVWLTCSPKPSSWVSFGMGLSSEVYQEIAKDLSGRRENWNELIEEVYERLLWAIEELKRPTNVRDWCINIEGQVKDADRKEEPLEYSSKAGFGIIDEYFDRFKKTEAPAASGVKGHEKAQEAQNNSQCTWR